MNYEFPSYVRRAVKVFVFAAFATLMVWRANVYVDPGGFTWIPQLFLCLTALLFGFIAFSIGLGLGGADSETR